MSQSLPVGRSAYLTALTKKVERKLQRALDSPAQRLDLLQELFTDVALEVDVRAQEILFDQNEDMINPAEVGMKSSPCFYEVLAEHFIQMPENGNLVLRLIVQLWSQSFASQIFSLLFYNCLNWYLKDLKGFYVMHLLLFKGLLMFSGSICRVTQDAFTLYSTTLLRRLLW